MIRKRIAPRARTKRHRRRGRGTKTIMINKSHPTAITVFFIIIIIIMIFIIMIIIMIIIITIVIIMIFIIMIIIMIIIITIVITIVIVVIIIIIIIIIIIMIIIVIIIIIMIIIMIIIIIIIIIIIKKQNKKGYMNLNDKAVVFVRLGGWRSAQLAGFRCVPRTATPWQCQEKQEKKQEPANCQPQDDDDFLSKLWENGRTLQKYETKKWKQIL